MDDLILGHALNLLDPAEQAAAQTLLRESPEARAKLAATVALFAELETDAPAPPPDLALSALARVAESLAETEPQTVPGAGNPRFPAPGRQYPVRKWVEAGLAASIAVLFTGLGVVGLSKVRRDAEVANCKNSLVDAYRGLDGYADTHNEHYPKVGTAAAPSAGGFVNVLAAAGQYPTGTVMTCPAAAGTPAPELLAFAQNPDAGLPDAGVSQVGYNYTLGYRGTAGGTVAARRGMGENVPLLADPGLPASAHRTGQNVLFAGGAVRYVTVPTVGPNGDDIYINVEGRVRAGLHVADASLGRADDVP